MKSVLVQPWRDAVDQSFEIHVRVEPIASVRCITALAGCYGPRSRACNNTGAFASAIAKTSFVTRSPSSTLKHKTCQPSLDE